MTNTLNKNQKLPIMPKATAVWLVDNTALTFKQIADFCGMHELEVKSIADGEVATGILGLDPIANHQLTKTNIEFCTNNPSGKLELINTQLNISNAKKKSKYIPIARRRDKPDAIYWLLKHCPNIQDNQIVKLIGTTKSTIGAIRDRSYWNIKNLKLRDPVLLGLCSQKELDQLIQKLSNEAILKENSAVSSST